MQIQGLNSSLIQEMHKVYKTQHNEKPNTGQLQPHQNNFQSILNNTIKDNTELQFSKHASIRLKSRNIQISDEQMKRIENGVAKAKEKGVKDSLVLVDNIALVINTRKNVVITAMEPTQDNENIYTNIDGAVIV